MKYLILLPVLLLSGCNMETCYWTDKDENDRHQKFLACMESLPAGPDKTHYNDWAEVVAECDAISLNHTKRVRECITR